MEQVREVVQHNADHCPRCGSGLVDALAENEGIRRYQCRPCGHLYTALIGNRNFGDVAGEPVARMPDDPKLKSKTPYRIDSRVGEELEDSPFRRTALEARRKEATMAVPTVCGKCHKEFSSKAYAKKHEKKCKGDSPGVATLTNGDGDPVVKILKAERDKIVERICAEHPDIQRLNSAIDVLEARPT